MEAIGSTAAGAGECRAFLGPGDRYRFLVTTAESGGSMFALDCEVGAGGGPPPHRHLTEDELFFIYEGSVDFTLAGVNRRIGAGESAFVPRGAVHSYTNSGDQVARMVAVYSPAGMEGWFREVCTPWSQPDEPGLAVTPELIERMVAAGPRHNIEWA